MNLLEMIKYLNEDPKNRVVKDNYGYIYIINDDLLVNNCEYFCINIKGIISILDREFEDYIL